MSSERKSRERMDRGDVAGVFERNGKLVLDVDKVIIRADEVIIIKKDDHREHHGKSDRGDVEGAADRNDRRDDRKRDSWFY
jgi:hypothetical protein